MKHSQSFAEEFKNVGLLLAGVTNHAAELAERGVDTAFITEFNNRYNQLLDGYNTQQASKARLKEETDTCEELGGKVDEYVRSTRKLVKLDLPQVSWVEFGIGDQQ